jgi:hypothetical protein
MSHVLGVYWAPGHNRYEDHEYMRALQPPAIRILDPDVSQLALAHRLAPNALLLPRDWALSEQHDDVRRDPHGTGIRHAQDWRGKINTWRSTGAALPPDDRIIVVGINEPRVWDMLPETVAYNVAFLDECTRLGLRACALNLSVGWPDNTGPDTAPDWSRYEPVRAAINRGYHFLCVHEYHYKSGPQDGAGWWCWRVNKCPWDVPIIIGECGIDNYVDKDRWTNEGKPPRGWGGNVDPSTFADYMTRYARGLDKRVVAILPFLTDYRSNEWASFDTRGAQAELLASASQMLPMVGKHTTHIPNVIAPTPPEPTAQPPVVQPNARTLDTRVMEAVMAVESGRRTHGADGRIIVRVEAHLLLSATYGKPDLFEPYFRFNRDNIFEAWYRPHSDGAWIAYHGQQVMEWAALNVAMGLHRETALRCTSMGAPQIMGFNAARVGFANAQDMFDVFGESAASQYVAMCNYMLSNPTLHAAINARDWPTIGKLYNGAASAGELYRQAYVRLWG